MVRSVVAIGCTSILVVAAFVCVPSDAQTANDLTTSLEHHNFVLRNYYTDDNLTFDSAGKLVSGSSPGFGPTDGLVEIEEVAIKRTAMTMLGQRPTYFWDKAQSEYKLTDIGRKVKIVINLPSAQTAEIANLLNQVFFSQSEIQQDKCLDTDRKLQDVARMTVAEMQSLSAQTLSETSKVCFPGGERVYPKAKDVLPPKVIHDPDPVYPKLRQNAPQQATVVLAIIVDTSGMPSTLVVTRPFGYGYDEETLAAVRHWRFKPAIINGMPTPVVINVEVNFRR